MRSELDGNQMFLKAEGSLWECFPPDRRPFKELSRASERTAQKRSRGTPEPELAPANRSTLPSPKCKGPLGKLEKRRNLAFSWFAFRAGHAVSTSLPRLY